MVGGFHKVYDLFITYVDSAYAKNTLWWTRVTDDLGSRAPEWSLDGSEIIYYKDMNANMANAAEPNYQICTIAPDGSEFEVLRKDWQMFGSDFIINPSLNPVTGQIAGVSLYDMKPQGLIIFDRDNPMVAIDSIRAWTMKNLQMVAPSWSPDGKWLAYIFNSMKEPGIYIATPDLSEKYLVFAPPVGTMLYTVAPSWSPDGKWLTFSTVDGSIWISDITGNQSRRVTPPGMDKNPAWSKGAK
jgi:Tol biopolymer transport system component